MEKFIEYISSSYRVYLICLLKLSSVKILRCSNCLISLKDVWGILNTSVWVPYLNGFLATFHFHLKWSNTAWYTTSKFVKVFHSLFCTSWQKYSAISNTTEPILVVFLQYNTTKIKLITTARGYGGKCQSNQSPLSRYEML